MFSGPLGEDIRGRSAEEIRRRTEERQSLQRRETEDYLRGETFRYPERQAQLWQRDYSCVSAYLRSVEPNRRRWQEAVGEFEAVGVDLEAQWEPFSEDDRVLARWVTVKAQAGLSARAILALPKTVAGPVPLVVCQHGIGSSPERVFGYDDPSNVYKGYGRQLVKQGFAVLAPLNITEGEPRARYERMAKLLGKTLWGLEIFKIRRLLDLAETLPQVDVRRTGMYGISLGGAYTSFTVPVEPRITVAVICAWFNHRLNKMIVDDPRYSCFLSSGEEHIIVPGWLREFTDSDLLSLICPRPVLIETGKCDSIAWWPQVLEEFERARTHYEKLGVADRIEMDLHEGGHEIRGTRAFEFLRTWLIDRALSRLDTDTCAKPSS
jgi:dienelactone hydrolase